MNPRIKNLKEKILSTPLEVSSKRAILVTEAYKETEGEPIPIRRVKALKKILEGLPVWIDKDELIVGHANESFRAASIFPEMHISWLDDELDRLEKRSQQPFNISEEAKQNIREIIPYWKGQTLYDFAFKSYPEEVIDARERVGLFSSEQNERGGVGNVILDYPMLLKNGLEKIAEDIKNRCNKLDPTDPLNIERIQFYKAAIITCEAAISFAKRYADLARSLAEKENDQKRKDELLKIADICNSVPRKPAETFWEALQSIWFVQLITQIETNGIAVSLGRMDQYLYQYYKNDILEGKLDSEGAQELLECFLIKLNELVRIYDEKAALINAGLPAFQNITIGGRDENNKDATNELTYMFLDALMELRLPQIHIVLKVHKTTPTALLQKAIKSIKAVQGMPALVGDEALEKFLLSKGVPQKEARTYALSGCVTPGVYGVWSRGGAAYVNLLKVLELALNNGVDPLTGIKAGPETGNAEEFKSMNDILIAFKKQLESLIKRSVVGCNILDKVQAEKMPHVFLSIFVRGCIENGNDATRGGARFNFTRIMGGGLPNVANSLAAIKKVVFDDKKINMKQLIDSLRNNFGRPEDEKIRRMLLSAPKYGNDDDYVDDFAVKISDLFMSEVEKYRNPRNGVFIPAYQTLLSNIYFGWRTGATPDGRLTGEALADTLSPVHGTDKKGPTAVLSTVAKIDHARSSGTILNLKFNRTVLENERDEKKLIDLIKGYLVDLGASHVQFNVISSAELRDAQQHPEKYRDLIVRVTGYSAYFVELSKDVQDDIIGRTEQVLI